MYPYYKCRQLSLSRENIFSDFFPRGSFVGQTNSLFSTNEQCIVDETNDGSNELGCLHERHATMIKVSLHATAPFDVYPSAFPALFI